MSAILIAMTGKTKNQNTENQNTEKMARDNIAKMVHVIEMVNSLDEYLDSLIDNPFFIKCNNNIVKFRVELNRFIALPYNISKIIFGDIVEIRELNVRCSAIELWYAYTNNTVKVYTIDLYDTKIRIKDLFMLLFIMDKMDPQDLNVFIANLNSIQDSIEAERNFIHAFLRNNGIETHG